MKLVKASFQSLLGPSMDESSWRKFLGERKELKTLVVRVAHTSIRNQPLAMYKLLQLVISEVYYSRKSFKEESGTEPLKSLPEIVRKHPF